MAQPIIGRFEFSFYLLYTVYTYKLRNPGSGNGTQNFGTRDSGTQILETVPGTREFQDSVPGTENFLGHGPDPVLTPGVNCESMNLE